MPKWSRTIQSLVFRVLKKGVAIWNLFLLSRDSDQEISEAMVKLDPPAKSEVFLFFFENMYIQSQITITFIFKAEKESEDCFQDLHKLMPIKIPE